MIGDPQVWLTALLGLVAFFGGIVVNDQRRELRELKAFIHALPEKYVLRDDYTRFQEAVLKKLDKIQDKLEDKADRRET